MTLEPHQPEKVVIRRVPFRWLWRSILGTCAFFLYFSALMAFVVALKPTNAAAVQAATFALVTLGCFVISLTSIKFHRQYVRVESDRVIVKGWGWKKHSASLATARSLSIVDDYRVTFWLGKGVKPARCWWIKFVGENWTASLVGDHTPQTLDEMKTMARDLASEIGIPFTESRKLGP